MLTSPPTGGNSDSVGYGRRGVFLRLDDVAGTGHSAVARRGMIAMRRFAVIVALGALLSMFGGVATPAPALAGGRGDGWEFFPFTSGTVDGFCPFPVFFGVPSQNVFQKVLTSPPGATIFLLNGSLRLSFAMKACPGRTVISTGRSQRPQAASSIWSELSVSGSPRTMARLARL